MAIAARFPLKLSRSLQRSDYSEGYGLVFLKGILEVRGQAVTILNVHLETPRDGLEPMVSGKWDVGAIKHNYRIREHEASLVAAEAEYNSIIAGDFNMPVESPLYRRFFADLSNAFDQSGNGFGWTKRTKWHGVRIDHILSPSAFIPLDCFVGPDFGSDHLPIVATLKLLELRQ